MIPILLACVDLTGTMGQLGGDPDPTLPEDPVPSTMPSTTSPTTPPVPITIPEPDSVVRFIALGDAGEGNIAQYAVADAMEVVCADLGCDFVLYLGDNFYDTGVSGVDDEQFYTKFESPYEELDLTFYVVMGNHDLGFDGVGLEFWKAPYYVEYSGYSTKWTMPDTYYALQTRNVVLLGLDTTEIFFDLADDQQSWFDNEIAQINKKATDWVIAYGHHPYISNGRHGNAGEYEGIADWIPGLGIPRGDYVKEFFDESVCGKVDLYLSGHDHNRQWLEDTCGTTFVVSGAGAKTTDLEGRGTPTLFEDDTRPGFLWVEIEGLRLTAKFFDQDGKEDYHISYTKEKTPSP